MPSMLYMISPVCNLTRLHLLTISPLTNLYTFDIIVDIIMQGEKVTLVIRSTRGVGLSSIILILLVVPARNQSICASSEITQNEGFDVDNITSFNNSASAKSTGSFPKIHTHVSGEKGIFVNGYLVETANGVVAIDSALTVNESKALKARLDSIKKPLLAILITHPHPDHVAGITYLVPPPSTVSSFIG